jgi:hypothetical protein
LIAHIFELTLSDRIDRARAALPKGIAAPEPVRLR